MKNKWNDPRSEYHLKIHLAETPQEDQKQRRRVGEEGAEKCLPGSRETGGVLRLTINELEEKTISL